MGIRCSLVSRFLNFRYEMLVGIPPFFHKNKHKMYTYIKEAPVKFPDAQKHNISLSPEATDLISKVGRWD